MTETFRPWKRPSRLLSFLAAAFSPRKLVAEQLPAHHARTANPVLEDAQIQSVLALTTVWIDQETEITDQYVDSVHEDPPRGDVYFHRYRQRCNEVETNFRLHVTQILALQSAHYGYAIPEEEIALFFELASKYKDWAVRHTQPMFWSASPTPLNRAMWFFMNFMITWQRQQ